MRRLAELERSIGSAAPQRRAAPPGARPCRSAQSQPGCGGVLRRGYASSATSTAAPPSTAPGRRSPQPPPGRRPPTTSTPTSPARTSGHGCDRLHPLPRVLGNLPRELPRIDRLPTMLSEEEFKSHLASHPRPLSRRDRGVGRPSDGGVELNAENHNAVVVAVQGGTWRERGASELDGNVELAGAGFGALAGGWSRGP
jgi:hypothetical protein